MFCKIQTNGANTIAIHIPHEGADKFIPALCNLLENNAVFMQESYNHLSVVKPDMQIILGNEIKVESYGQEAVIFGVPQSQAKLDDSFILADSPEVFVSNRKELDKKEKDNQSLREENSYLKKQIETLKNELQELADT